MTATPLTSDWRIADFINSLLASASSERLRPSAPATTVRALTLSLIVLASTLMWLAVLVEERRQTQQALRIRLEFESLLSRLSSALMQHPSAQMARAFESWLGRIGRAFLS